MVEVKARSHLKLLPTSILDIGDRVLPLTGVVIALGIDLTKAFSPGCRQDPFCNTQT